VPPEITAEKYAGFGIARARTVDGITVKGA